MKNNTVARMLVMMAAELLKDLLGYERNSANED